MTENETSENTVEQTCDGCIWESKEDMVTGVFMMPKGLYKAIEKERGKSIEQEPCEENCSEIFYGRRILFGVASEIEKKKAMRKFESFFEVIKSL